MDEQTRREALQRTRHALDLIEKSELTRDEQDRVIADCVRNFDKYVNPGILEYRKSVSTDYTAVEWCDEGSTFKDIHGREFIDCLGGYGIYMLGHRHPPSCGQWSNSWSARRCTPRSCSTPCGGT